MKFYENKNNNIKSKFFKRNNRIQSFIPIKHEKPIFDIGEIVGFRYFYQSEEGIIDSYKYKKDGKIEYIVKIRNRWGLTGIKQKFKSYDMYLKPLTRMVLFEKSPSYRKKYEVKISYTGSTMMYTFVMV